jgi:hypothetical protein
MTLRTRAPLVVAALLAALALLAAAIPAPAARAQTAPGPTSYGWDITADFTGSAPLVKVTSYKLVGDPAVVASSSTQDISTRCVQRGTGTIAYPGGRAVFDGKAYLRCELPPLLVGLNPGPGNGVLYFSAVGTFDTAARANPILAASDGSFSFSVPGNGAQLRTRVELPPQAYETPPWARSATGNQVLLGQSGQTMATLNSSLGLLSFLDPSWASFFQPLDKARVGGWAFSGGGAATWSDLAAAVTFRRPPSHVFIGFNPATGAIFKGELSYAAGDPPGATVKE